MAVDRNEYKRARKNAQARYNRLLNKGYAFSENPIPSIPKKITEASIRRLNALTSRELRGKASWGVSIETGEIVTPLQAYNEQRRRTSLKQSNAQKAANETRQIREKIYSEESGLVRAKGETHKQFIERAEHQIEVDTINNYYYEDYDYYDYPVKEADKLTKEEFYDRQREIDRRHIENIRKKLLEEFGVIVPLDWSDIDVMQYYHYMKGYGGPHPELPVNEGFEPVSSTPFDKLSEDEYAIEIENAYDSGEFEMARELENERDYYYPIEDANIASISYESRLLDAIDIVKQYSPEVGAKLEESFQYYMDRKDAVAFEQGLSKQQMEAFQKALAQVENVKYLPNEMALWTIYTKIDYAINSRHHSKAERVQFFGRIQSGDFQYE